MFFRLKKSFAQDSLAEAAAEIRRERKEAAREIADALIKGFQQAERISSDGHVELNLGELYLPFRHHKYLLDGEVRLQVRSVLSKSNWEVLFESPTSHIAHLRLLPKESWWKFDFFGLKNLNSLS